MNEFFQSIGTFCTDFWGGIVDWFINAFNGIVGGITELFSAWLNGLGLTVEIPSDVYVIFNELFYGVGYIFPVRALLPIPMFWLAFYIAKFIFAVYRIIASTVVKRIKVKV